ncbi:MAG: hypothetical protein K0S28_1687 [Paucimonas sp.]|nr:hypothetical protein [Paucimonas sp.]
MKNSMIALSMLFAASAAWAESASTIRAADLQEQSQLDSAVLATLAPNTQVNVLRRVGAWSEVKTADGKTGWVKMTALKFAPESGAQASGNAKSGGGALGGLLTAGRTSSSATVTTGVKGLTAEDLQNAQADTVELEKLKALAVNSRSAKNFAGNPKLTVNQVEYLEPAGSRKSRSEEQ